MPCYGKRSWFVDSRLIIFSVACLTAPIAEAVAPPLPSRDVEMILLKRYGWPTDTNSLINFLRLHSPQKEDRDRINRLIDDLGNDRFVVREEAVRKLLRLGDITVPYLKKALANSDLEISRRAQELLRRIPTTEATVLSQRLPLPRLALRLLVKRRETAIVPLMIRYLPFTDDPIAVQDIYFALLDLGFPGGKTHPALIAALADAEPSRRAAAACVLAVKAIPEHKEDVRKLLADGTPEVRLRAAQGLLAAGNSESIPTLIELLVHSPLEIAWQAEELLRYVAAGRAPDARVLNGDVQGRRQCRQVWLQWHRRTGGAIDPEAISRTTVRPGLIMVHSVVPLKADPGGSKLESAQLSLYGCDGRLRHVVPLPKEVSTWLWLPDRTLIYHDDEKKFIAKSGTGKHLWEVQGSRYDTWLQQLTYLGRDRFLALGKLQIKTFKIGKVTGNLSLPHNISDNYSVHNIDSNGICYHIRHTDPLRTFGIDPITGNEIAGSEAPLRGSSSKSRQDIRDGYLLFDDHAEGSDVVRSTVIWEENARGELIWERDFPEIICSAQEAFPLLRFGFLSIASNSELSKASYWIRQLQSCSIKVRRRASLKLTKLKLTEDEAFQVARFLADEDSVVHALLVQVLERSPRLKENAIPYLVATFRDKGNQPSTGSVGLLLKKIGNASAPALAALIHDTQNPSFTRQRAVSALVNWLDYQPAAKVIRKAFFDKDPKVQYSAMLWVCVEASDNQAARKWIPEIVALLKSKNVQQAQQAVLALGSLSRAAHLGLPHVIESCKDKRLKLSALGALWKIAFVQPKLLRNSPELFPILLKYLEPSEEPDVIRQASWVIDRVYGHDRKKAMPLLIKALNDRRHPQNKGDMDERLTVMYVLRQTGKHAGSATKSLAAIAGDTREKLSIRQEAIKTLSCIGPNAKDAIPTLVSIFEKANSNIKKASSEIDKKANEILRQHALIALSAIDPETAKRFDDTSVENLIPSTPLIRP